MLHSLSLQRYEKVLPICLLTCCALYFPGVSFLSPHEVAFSEASGLYLGVEALRDQSILGCVPYHGHLSSFGQSIKVHA